MKEIILLSDLYFKQLKNNLSQINKEKVIKFLLFLFFSVIFFPLVYYLFFFIFKHFYTAQIIGPLLLKKLLYTFYMTFTVMIILSSIVAAIPVLYFSKEMDFLFSCPIKIESIFFIKYIKVIIDACWMIFMLIIPIFIAYSRVIKIDFFQYIFIVLSHIPFFIICVSVGLFLTIVLIKYFPGEGVRNVVVAIYGIFLVFFIIYFRMLQPEKITGASANEIMEFVRYLKTPDSIFFPHSHIMKIINNISYSGILAGISPFILFLSISIIFFAIIILIAKFWYFDGFAKKGVYNKRKIFIKSYELKKTSIFMAQLKKDIKYFVRDTTQWIQIVFLFGIVFIYLFNIFKLPVDLYNLREFIYFLNIGFIGLVMSAVGARLILPVISIEGRGFWIYKIIPDTIKNYILYKIIIYGSFLVGLGILVAIISLGMLKTSLFINIITIFSTFLINFVIVGTGIGLGAYFADFKIKNPEDLITGLPGLFYMLITFLFVGLLLVVEAGVVKDYYFTRLVKVKEFHIINYLPNFILISLVAFFLFFSSLFIGIKRLEKLEI